MRTKADWEVVEGANGKKAPQKIGLKPEQREGTEYEFTVVLDLSLESHIATASKVRTSLFDGRHFVPTFDTGKELRKWLESGQDPEEINKGFLASLKAEASGIDQVFYLDEWGWQHRADFDRLQPDHRKELVAFCVDLRQQILKAA